MSKSTWGSIACIVFGLALMFGISSAKAQEATKGDNTESVMKRVHATSADFMSRYKSRIDKVGALKGPWDVVVGTTDKATAAIKYNNVPFVFLGNGFAAFPAGTSTKGAPDYIITSNFTLYMRK